MAEGTNQRREPPPQIELKTSQVEPDSIGIWSRQAISAGDRFGPIEGEKVQQSHDDMDPSFVWEIVDLESKEHLWYLDASDPEKGNWMRNMKCARFLEEQNILSLQQGTDIYYRAMQDIPAGVELLTWYERVKLKKGRKSQKNADKKSRKRNPRRNLKREYDDSDGGSFTNDEACLPTKKTKRQLTRELSRNSLKSANVEKAQFSPKVVDHKETLDPGGSNEDKSQSNELKYVQAEPNIGQGKTRQEIDAEDLTGNEAGAPVEKETEHRRGKKAADENVKEMDDRRGHQGKRSLSVKADIREDNQEDFFHFAIKEEHIIRNRLGRKVFLCDICSGLYKHSFSLKRHYIKHHINHKYVTQADLTNCHITKQCVIIPNSASSVTSSQQLSVAASPSNIADSPTPETDSPGDQQSSEVTSSATSGNDVTVSCDKIKCETNPDPPTSEDCMEVKDVGGAVRSNISSQLTQVFGSNGDMHDTALHTSCTDNSVKTCDTNDDMRNIVSTIGVLKDAAGKASTEPLTYPEQKQSQDSTDSYESSNISSNETVEHETEHNPEETKISCSNGSTLDTAGHDIPCCDTHNERQPQTHCDDKKKKGGILKALIDTLFKKAAEKSDVLLENNHANVQTGLEINTTVADTLVGITAECETNKENGMRRILEEHDTTKHQAVDCYGVDEKRREHCEHTGAVSTGDAVPTDISNTHNIDMKPAAAEPQTNTPLQGITKETDTAKLGLERLLVEMPGLYRCNTCNATFDTIPGIRAHIKHHPQDANTAKLLSCDQCDMKFTEKKNLMRHQASHNTTGTAKPQQRQCKSCTKQFTNVKALRRHERSHGGERETCEHCATSFSQSCDLRKHIRRTHPTCFHECAFCARYFSRKKLLVEHLPKHNKKLQDNKTELANRKDNTAAIDPVLDKAESMRLAGNRTTGKVDAFKYACTVCKKRFADYTNMCRHRRMAHLRHLMETVKASDKRNVRIFESSSIIRTRSAVEREMVDFYACVSDNIKDNLDNYMMGKTMLDNAASLIKWFLPPNCGTFDTKKEHAQKSSTTTSLLSKCNFPKTFRLKDPDQLHKDVNTRKNRHQSFSLQRDKGEDYVPSEETEHSCKDSCKTNHFHDLATLPKPIYLPSFSPVAKDKLRPISQTETKEADFKTCAVCKITFNETKEYRDHMREKHGVYTSEIAKEIANEKNNITDKNNDNKPKYPLKICKPDINIPVTIQHEKPEQDEVVDLSGACNSHPIQHGATGEARGHMDHLGLVTSAAGKVALKVPENVSTEDPTERFLRYMCKACYKEFTDWPQFMQHYSTQHPTIERGVSTIDPSLKHVWTHPSNSVGLLNVCSAHTSGLEPKQQLHCTKCHKRFTAMPDLHKHMLTCADPESLRPKYVWVYQYRKQKYSKMIRKRTCEWQKKVGTPKKSGATDPDAMKSTVNGQFAENNMTDKSFIHESLDTSQDGFDDGKKRRRKPFEVTYNPTRHTRRRQMAELVDTSICGGCEEDFKTISLLERHIPVCTHKDKIRELESLKSVHDTENSDSDSSDDYDPNKHLCIYCLRQFTYARSLRNHIFDICAVRKEFVNKNEYLDDEWEQDLIEKTGGKKEQTLSRHSSVSSLANLDDDNSKDQTELKKSADKRQRRRRRGNGWAHKNKPNAFNRTINQVVSEDGYIYEYFVESEVPIISFDLADTFILDVDQADGNDATSNGDAQKRTKKALNSPVGVSNMPQTVSSPPFVPRPSFGHHEEVQAEDLSQSHKASVVNINGKRGSEKAKKGGKVVTNGAVIRSDPTMRRTRRAALMTEDPKNIKADDTAEPDAVTDKTQKSKQRKRVFHTAKVSQQKVKKTPRNVVSTKASKSNKSGANQLKRTVKSRLAGMDTKSVLAKCVKKKLAQKRLNGHRKSKAVTVETITRPTFEKQSTTKTIRKKSKHLNVKSNDGKIVENTSTTNVSPSSPTTLNNRPALEKTIRPKASSSKVKAMNAIPATVAPSGRRRRRALSTVRIRSMRGNRSNLHTRVLKTKSRKLLPTKMEVTESTEKDAATPTSVMGRVPEVPSCSAQASETLESLPTQKLVQSDTETNNEHASEPQENIAKAGSLLAKRKNYRTTKPNNALLCDTIQTKNEREVEVDDDDALVTDECQTVASEIKHLDSTLAVTKPDSNVRSTDTVVLGKAQKIEVKPKRDVLSKRNTGKTGKNKSCGKSNNSQKKIAVKTENNLVPKTKKRKLQLSDSSQAPTTEGIPEVKKSKRKTYASDKTQSIDDCSAAAQATVECTFIPGYGEGVSEEALCIESQVFSSSAHLESDAPAVTPSLKHSLLAETGPKSPPDTIRGKSTVTTTTNTTIVTDKPKKTKKKRRDKTDEKKTLNGVKKMDKISKDNKRSKKILKTKRQLSPLKCENVVLDTVADDHMHLSPPPPLKPQSPTTPPSPQKEETLFTPVSPQKQTTMKPVLPQKQEAPVQPVLPEKEQSPTQQISPQKPNQNRSSKASLETMLNAWNETALKPHTKVKPKKPLKKCVKLDFESAVQTHDTSPAVCRITAPREAGSPMKVNTGASAQQPLDEAGDDMFTMIKKKPRKRKIVSYEEYPDDCLNGELALESDNRAMKQVKRKKSEKKSLERNADGQVSSFSAENKTSKSKRKERKEVVNGALSKKIPKKCKSSSAIEQPKKRQPHKPTDGHDLTNCLSSDIVTLKLNKSAVNNLKKSLSTFKSRTVSPERKPNTSATGSGELSTGRNTIQFSDKLQDINHANVESSPCTIDTFHAMESLRNVNQNSKVWSPSPTKRLSKKTKLTEITPAIISKDVSGTLMHKNGQSVNTNVSNNNTPVPDSIDLVTNTVCKAMPNSPTPNVSPRKLHPRKIKAVKVSLNTSNNLTMAVHKRVRDIFDFTDESSCDFDIANVKVNVDSGDYSDATEPYDECDGVDGYVSDSNQINSTVS